MQHPEACFYIAEPGSEKPDYSFSSFKDQNQLYSLEISYHSAQSHVQVNHTGFYRGPNWYS